MTADVGGQSRKFEYPYLPWKLQAVNGVDRSLKRLGLLRRNDRYKTPCPVASSSLQCRLSRGSPPTFCSTDGTRTQRNIPLSTSPRRLHLDHLRLLIDLSSQRNDIFIHVCDLDTHKLRCEVTNDAATHSHRYLEANLSLTPFSIH